MIFLPLCAKKIFKVKMRGTSQTVQWFRLHASKAECRFDLWLGAKIPHAMQGSKKKKNDSGKYLKELKAPFNSVQFSCSVVSSSLPSRALQHARLPCPSPTPGVYSNSCPLSQWCHPTISFSVVPLLSCLQSFQASGPFQMSQLFASDGQSIRISASISVLPMKVLQT